MKTPITPNLWIFPIEPLPTRYSGQWHASIPNELSFLAGEKFNVRQVDGIQKNTEVSKGAFLNFSDTNYWKSSQLLNFLELHNNGETTPNDRFLITDFWNPVAIQLKYISELTNLNWKLHGIAHAGSYDPQDFLGRLIDDKRWTKNTERALFHAFDYLYFATDFHIDLFINGVFEPPYQDELIANDRAYKFIKSGQPHDSLVDELNKFANLPKRDLILFPHRLAPEKQVEIFRDLKKEMPEYEFIVCQDTKLTKDEYHTLLGESKMVFSANLQETLGIGQSEAVLANSIPLVPDRLSYSEMYLDEFKYPSEWTTDYNAYLRNKPKLIAKIRYMMEHHNDYTDGLNSQYSILVNDYFSAHIMYKNILK